MKKIRSLSFSVAALSIWLVLSGWGTTGHYKINHHAPASFPSGMNFLRASWTTYLADNASVADERKQWDDSESPKHYIDIDNYSEFIQHGRIPMTLDSVVTAHGISFVLDNGILPWATITAFDSLKACFMRNNFSKAADFAADLGHYVADGHQPLHITRNYDGQYTSQDGVHSRFETRMVNNYNNSIVYGDDTAEYISDVRGYIFTYLYHNYTYIDSILQADNYAVSVAGNTSSTAYYQAFWDRAGNFTTGLFKHASYALASLIYTAWVEAGNPNGIPLFTRDAAILGQNLPNPFHSDTSIPLTITGNDGTIILKVFDSQGKLVATLVNGKMSKGSHRVIWDATGHPSGIYYYTLQSGDTVISRKMILAR
jgi:hypothetical protein